MTSVSETSLQTLEGISQLPETVRSDLRHAEDDVTCSSSAMPICDGDGFPKAAQPLEALRESLGPVVGRPLSAKKNKDPLCFIEKPIISHYQSNGAYSPSDGSWTPRSDLSDSDAASYLNFKFETDDGQQSETRLERLNGLNRQWNDLHYQQKSYGNELTEGVQSHLDDLEKGLETNSNSLANVDDMLPLEVQLEQVASSQDNLLALIPKLDEISEVAEMLVESPNEDAKGSDASEAVNGLQSQVVDLSQRFSAVLNQCDERKNDILRRIEEEASVGTSKLHKKETESDLAQLSCWYQESYDLIVAEVFVTFDKSILKEILQQSQDIEEGSRNREKVVSEMLQQAQNKRLKTKTKDVSSLEELKAKFGDLGRLSKKKVEDLGRLLKLSVKREQEIEFLQTQVANLQKWVESRHTPPDLLVPAVIGVADSFLSSQSSQAMQQAIQDEVAALEAFMAEVHEEGLHFLKNTRPYTVKSDNLGSGLTSSNDEDGSDTEQSSIIADSATQFLNQWNYLKHRLEKRKAKISRQLLHNSKQGSYGTVSVTTGVLPEEELSEQIMPPLETRVSNESQQYEAELSTKSLQLQFETLSSCWKSIISQVKEKDMRLTDILELQSTYLDSLNDAVLWLDSLELEIFSTSLVKTCEEQLLEHEVLFREMKAFESEFLLLNNICNEVLQGAMSSPRREKAARMADELQTRIKELETAIKRKDEEVQLDTLNRQNQQKKLNDMFEKLEELREQVLDSLKRPDLNVEEKKQRCSAHEAEHKILDSELGKLSKNLEAVASSSHVDFSSLTQFNILEKLLDDVKFFINQFSSKIVNDEDLKEQMIKLISDYDSFLVSAETHLISDNEEVSVISPVELETHLKDFKCFFEDLEGHWHVLNGFYEQMEPGTKLRFAEEMACLNLRTIKVKDQASDLGKMFEVTLQQWTNVDQSMRGVETWLIKAERLPIVSSYDSSLLQVHSYQEACELKQELTDLQGELYVQESKAHKVLQDAKILLKASLKCPSICGKTQVFERMWKELFAKVNKKHERVFMLVETWARFESGIREIFSWLQRVIEKLDRMKSESYSQMNAAELYLKLQSLMELGRDLIWNKMSVDRVRSIADTVQQICGNHFMPKEIDGKIVKLLSEWNYVNRELDVLKHNVQRYRQDAMPLQQHLVELSVWIDGLTATLRQEDIKLIQWNGQHVQTKLHKFKGIELDLSWTQHDLDHVNQQAIRQSQKAPLISLQSKRLCLNNQDIDSKGSSTPRMYGSDFLDRKFVAPLLKPRKNGELPPQLDSQIGVLNQRWNDLRNQVKSNIQVLVEYDSLWKDYDNNVEKLLQWIEYKKLVIMNLHSGCGHLIGVRQGLAELMALETELKEMCSQFEAVHQLGDKLLGKHNHVTSLVVTENETRLYKAKNYLTSQILQLRSHLEQVEQNWLRYDSILEPVSAKLSEAEFTISVNQNVSGTLPSYQQQLQTFKSFERSLSALQNNLAHLSNVTDEMCQLCRVPICEELRDNQKLLFDRWRRNVNDASSTLRKMEVNERNWMQYEKLYRDAESKLQELKVSVDSVEDSMCSKYISHTSCSTTQRKLSKEKIRRYIAQLQALDVQMKAIKLEELTVDKVTICDVLDSPTCLQVDAKFKYLVDEFDTTQLRCSKMESDLSSALEKHQEFEKVFSEVDLILKNCEDCSKRTIGDHKRKVKLRMEFIQEALANLDSQEYVLKKVNELSCQIIISDAETTALKRCNSKWTTLTKNLRKKLEDTEKIWLEQKSFAEKCQYWVDFVREASFRLKEAQSYVGSYEGFKQCYKNLQDLTNELVGKQPVMNSIMSEGRKLMFYEDETEIYSNQLERRIEETKEEWKQTVQFLDEEKTRTTQILEKWVNFKSDLSRMTQWLGNTSDELDSLQSSLMISEDSIRSQNYRSRLKHVDDQNARRIKDLQKLIQQSNVLMQLSDSETKIEIDQNICSIKNKWNDLNCKTKNLKILETDVAEKDHEVEANIEVLQCIVKEANKQFESLLVEEMNSKIATVRFSDTLDLALGDLKEQFHVISGLQTKFVDGSTVFKRLLTVFDVAADCQLISSQKLNSAKIAPKLRERFALVAKQWTPLKTQINSMAEKIEAKMRVCSQFQNLAEQIENSLDDCDKTLQKLAEADDIEGSKSVLQIIKNTQITFARTSMKILTENVVENLQKLISSSHKGAFKEANSRVEKLKNRLDHMDAVISKRLNQFSTIALSQALVGQNFFDVLSNCR